MLEERFDKNFTLTIDSQKGVIPKATIDGRNILIKSIDLQWYTDDDKYQGDRNYIKISFYFEDDLKKMPNDDNELYDEFGNPRQTDITIRQCLYDTENNEWTFPRNII